MLAASTRHGSLPWPTAEGHQRRWQLPRLNSGGATATTPRYYRRRVAVVRAAMDPDILPAAGAAAFAAALGIGGFRAALYSTLEYSKAATLAKLVPKGAATPSSRGAKVVLLGAAPRDLYYLPKDTLTAVVVGSEVNPSLFDQAGVSAGVPTTGKRVAPGRQAWASAEAGVAAPASLDAVVALGSALGKLPSRQELLACLREAKRALRPNRPLIFLQAIEGEGASPLRALIGPGGGAGAIRAVDLESALEEAGFAYIEWGVELQGTDPHALGVAVTPAEGGGGGDQAGAAESSGKRRRAAAAEKKGF
jgi:hypothetical protein